MSLVLPTLFVHARRIEDARALAFGGAMDQADRERLATLLDEVEAAYGREERTEIEAAITGATI